MNSSELSHIGKVSTKIKFIHQFLLLVYITVYVLSCLLFNSGESPDISEGI
jgi:hypothetical protein